MSTNKEQYVGKAKMKEAPDSPFRFKLKDKIIKNKHLDDRSVDARVIDNGAVTPEKVSNNFIQTLVEPLISSLRQQMINSISSLDAKYKGITDELYSMIRSIQVGGIALSDRLGTGEHSEEIGVTQKALTGLFNAFNARIDDIAGEWTQGFSMTVTPDTFISEDSCQVNISAVAASGTFDHITFYAGDTVIAEGDQCSSFYTTATISDSTVIRCVAILLGKQYSKEKEVTKFYPFFVGGGYSLEDALRPENARGNTGSPVDDYDFTMAEGDRIYVLMPLSWKTEFIRLDMNGYEIPMNVTTDDRFAIYESLNTYQAGEYNIDITDNRNE